MESHHPVVIIGAGITGMSCARRLKKDYLILEKTERPGGLCKTESVDGFVFEDVTHLIHIRTPEVKKEVEEILGDNKRFFEREAYTFLDGKLGDYPFQIYANHFSKQIQKECFEGLLKAHLHPNENPTNYKEWLLSRFGEGMCKHFFFPINEKQWLRPLEEMVVGGTSRFVPKASIHDFVCATFLGEKIIAGYNPQFFFPLKGGIESLSKGMARDIHGMKFHQEVSRIDVSRKIVQTQGGESFAYDWLVATMPLPNIIRAIADAPAEIKEAAKKLSYVSELNVNLGVKGTPPKGQWIYVPETKYPFFRVNMGSKLAPGMAPEGHYSLWVESTFRPENKPDVATQTQKIIDGLLAAGFIQKKSDIVVQKTIIVPHAYVVYDHAHEENVKKILDYLEKNHIKAAGRFGEWKYTSIEDSILDGWRMADAILDKKLKQEIVAEE